MFVCVCVRGIKVLRIEIGELVLRIGESASESIRWEASRTSALPRRRRAEKRRQLDGDNNVDGFSHVNVFFYNFPACLAGVVWSSKSFPPFVPCISLSLDCLTTSLRPPCFRENEGGVTWDMKTNGLVELKEDKETEETADRHVEENIER